MDINKQEFILIKAIVRICEIRKGKIMNSFIDAMNARRTIRRYEDKAVPKEVVNELMKAVQRTQSWANSQCWEVVMVEDESIRNEIFESMPSRNPATAVIKTAPLLFVLCARKGVSGNFGKGTDYVTKHGDWYMYDLGIATQNLCLAGHALGLGSVVVGWYDIDRVEAAINVPEDVEVVSVITMGYSEAEKPMPKRRDVDEFLYVDRFDAV